MKHLSFPIYLLLGSALGMLSLTSCGDIQQELYLNADGSGKLEASFDLGDMMSMMKGFGDAGVPDDSLSDDTIPKDTAQAGPTTPKDPMQTIMERVTDPGYDRDFDTLISFMDLMPDSVRQKENRMDLVKKMSIHMKSPAKSSSMVIGLLVDFDNQKQLQDIMNHMDTLDGQKEIMAAGPVSGFNKNSFMGFDVDMKAGRIRIDSIDYSQYGNDLGMPVDTAKASEDMNMMQMMFGNSKVRTIVHVPGEVISCSNKDAIITKDEKVIVEYDFMDAYKKGKAPGYSINFKPKK